MFYAEYNFRLFFYLLFKKCDAICAIDADTLMAVFLASSLRKKKRLYDAHEYFSQMKEVISRPKVHRIWQRIEKRYIPKFPNGYTVSESISKEFERLYSVKYETIRNLPHYGEYPAGDRSQKNIIYRGAVNEARGLEFLIPAMQHVNAKLYIYGEGNFFREAKELTEVYRLQDKVLLMGMQPPTELEKRSADGYIGINLVENTGLNQYYSLANKFFDHIMHAQPQVTMNFPEYAAINAKYEVAVLIDELSEQTIVNAVNRLLTDDELYVRLQNNCRTAAKELNWEAEEKKLLSFYKNIL
jgi:glycosyltransferase involved in cell wall biosynthesis